MRRLTFGKFIFAIILVGLGVMLLLVNTNVISLEINAAIVAFYPVLFVIFGLWLLFEPLTRRRKPRAFWGLFFLIFGGLLLGDRLGYLDFSFWMIWKLWPFLLIYIGIKTLFGRGVSVKVTKDNHNKPHGKKTAKFRGKSHGKSGWHLVTDLTMSDPNWSVEPMDVWYMVGDYDFDFSKAFIPDKNTEIKLTGWVGDVKFLIPDEVPFSVEAHASVGELKIGGTVQEGIGKSLNYKTTDYDEATRKLTFILDFKVLDLRVDRV